MSEPEKFLERWARRKRVAGEPPEKPAASEPGTPPAAAGPPDDKPVAAAAPETPVFDPTSLPSIDSIGADTDLSAFLKPGVPGELKLAALRRAWSVDPAIRDFKGLQENDWNFNDPNGIPGFGELDPSFDVKKMLRDLFGETPAAEEANTEIPQPPEQLTPPQQQSVTAAAADIDPDSVSEPAAPLQDEPMVQREINIAAQNGDEKNGDENNKRRRSQGRALPQ
jgi:hypothetical protein